MGKHFLNEKFALRCIHNSDLLTKHLLKGEASTTQPLCDVHIKMKLSCGEVQ